MKRMAGGSAVYTVKLLHRECGRLRLHDRMAGHQAEHWRGDALSIGQSLQQIQHPAAFGEDGLAKRRMGADCSGAMGMLRERLGMPLRIAAGQIESVSSVWQRFIRQRRKKTDLRTQRAK